MICSETDWPAPLEDSVMGPGQAPVKVAPDRASQVKVTVTGERYQPVALFGVLLASEYVIVGAIRTFAVPHCRH